MPTKLENYYTEQEVAEILNKTISSLRTDASRRKGAPRTRVGKLILYKKDSFEKWLESKEIDFDELRETGSLNKRR